MAAPCPSPIHVDRQASIIRRRALAQETFELTLQLPPGFTFAAGQHIRVHVGEHARDYSLIPTSDHRQSLILVRRIPSGTVSEMLARVAPGAPLTISGPRGRFLFQPGAEQPVFVATGTGIAPFAAMQRDGVRGQIILHGVRTAQELYYREELQLGARRYIPCLSGAWSEAPGAFSGRVTDYLAERLAPGGYAFYLAGRREMIADAMAIIDARFPHARVFSEIFF